MLPSLPPPIPFLIVSLRLWTGSKWLHQLFSYGDGQTLLKRDVALMKPPDWLPDWLDKSQYPDPHKTSEVGWAWEFLRRNPDYQKLWEQAHILKYVYNPKDIEAYLRRAKKEGGLWHVNTQQRSFSQAPFIKRFRLESAPPDPATPNATLLFSGQFLRFAHKQTYGADEVRANLHNGQVLVWFDLNWPIQRQLENAKQLLYAKAPEAEKRRIRFAQFRNYLRLLDAKCSGATVGEMADKIYPRQEGNQQKVRDQLKAAIRYCTDPWRIVISKKK